MFSNIIEKKKWKLKLLLLLVILFMSMVITATVGTANISVMCSLKILMNKIPLLGRYINIGDIPENQIFIIESIRLPRIILAVLVGIALSISGVSFQGMLKNPMADPYVIGISSGAALGATMGIVNNVKWSFIGITGVSMFAFASALITTFLVYNISKIKTKVPITTLLLSGIAVGQFLTSITSLIMVINTNDMNRIIYWTLGSFSTKGWLHVKAIAVPVLLGYLLLWFFSKDLNAILLGEESAQNLGIEVEKTKKILLGVNAFIVAMAVSVSGIIGFVGLIIPHVVRIIVGPDHRILFPVAGLFGGIFLLLADTFARTLIDPMEIPVGIITALFGGPFFILLLRKKKESLL